MEGGSPMKDRSKHGKEQEIAVLLKEAAPACAE